MKKYAAVLVLMVAGAAACIFSGCILDAFDEIVQNMSIERNFTLSGNTNQLTDQSGTFRLSDSKVYTDNRDKIKKMRYKAAALVVSENSVPSLQGDMTVTLSTSTGVPLFTKTLTAFRPSDYAGVAAKNIDLTASEVDAVNAYLSNVDQLDTIGFTAGLRFRNVTPANTTVTLRCFVSLALEMTINP